MLYLDKLENLKFNRAEVSMPKIKNKKGLALIIDSINIEQSKSLINSIIFKNRIQINGYHMPYMYHFKLFNRLVNDKIITEETYNTIKENCRNITKTFKTITQYNSSNLYLDISKYNQFFYERIGNRKGIMALKEYDKMMDIIDESLGNNYQEKYLLIDLQFHDYNYKKSDAYTLANSKESVQFIYQLMSRDIENFKKFPFKIFIFNKKQSVLIKPEECDSNSSNELEKILKLFNVTSNTKEELLELEKEERKDNIRSRVKSKIIGKNYTKFNFNGKPMDEELEEKVDLAVDESLKDINDSDDIDEDIIDKQIEIKTKEILNEDKDFLTKLRLSLNDSFTDNSRASTKRNQMLAEKQAKLKINNSGLTIDEIINNANSKKLIPLNLKIHTLNPDMRQMMLPNFTKSYNKHLMEKDTMSILNCFKDKRNPVYIIDIKKEDTSTVFDKKYTYTIKMESADRVRHTITVDLPKFVDDSFLYLGGNKKNIISQLVLKPVCKTAPDTVQFCSFYNKIFMRRTGNRISPKLERLKKTILQNNGASPRSKLYVKNGNNSLVNTAFKTVIEYDELAKEFMNIYIDNSKIVFYFNQNYIRDYIKKNNLKEMNDDNLLPIAIRNGKEVVYMNTEKNIIEGVEIDFADYVIKCINDSIPGFKEKVGDMTSGKKYMYTNCTIMAKKVPTILLLSYLEGLSTVLKKAEINFEFTDKRLRQDTDDKLDKGCIEFADGFLYYDRYPFRNSLLMNALALIPTKEFNYADFDNKETYLSLFEELYSNRMVLNAFENFYDLFIDPVTLEVLEDLNLPTDFVSLLLHGNSLLEDNQYVKENDMSLYRLRNNEMVNVILYQQLADAYSRYRTSIGNKHPEKISIPRDAVIKDLVMLKNVEDFSTLNPILEAEKLRAVSYKGPTGMNLEQAYTLEKRAYDKSMRGVLAMSSPNSGTVGMIRQMAMDANILSPRGYLKVVDNDAELNSANVFCPSEALTPFCAQSDDAPRVAMVTAQSKHIVPCKGYSPLLITNGADKAIGSIISNEYVFKAKEDGKVVEINKEAEIAVLKYKSGKVDMIDLGKHITKNGGINKFAALKTY